VLPSSNARPLVYHSNHEGLSTSHFCYAGHLATADTCVLCVFVVVAFLVSAAAAAAVFDVVYSQHCLFTHLSLSGVSVVWLAMPLASLQFSCTSLQVLISTTLAWWMRHTVLVVVVLAVPHFAPTDYVCGLVSVPIVWSVCRHWALLCRCIGFITQRGSSSSRRGVTLPLHTTCVVRSVCLLEWAHWPLVSCRLLPPWVIHVWSRSVQVLPTAFLHLIPHYICNWHVFTFVQHTLCLNKNRSLHIWTDTQYFVEM